MGRVRGGYRGAMRRHLVPLSAAIAAAVLLAACGGGSPTLPPLPPEATERPSLEPGGIPSDHPSIGPTAAPTIVDPTPVTAAPPTPVGGQEQPAVVLVAVNIAFEPTELSVPAGVGFTIGLDNRDVGIPHNVEVFGLDGSSLVKSEIVNGPAQQVVQVPALAPGTYPFTCTVHPNMTGTITAE